MYKKATAVICMEKEYDALDTGIELGGLRTRSNVRLLICYILQCIGHPVKKELIITSMQKNGIANYFEITDAFVDLQNKDNIAPTDENQELYTVTKSGKFIASNLGEELPRTVRERALATVCDLMAQEQSAEENTAEIIKQKTGYVVDCHIKGGESDLFSFQIYVPDSKQARLVKKNFQANPEMIYKMMVATITGNSDFAEQTLEDIKNKGIRLSNGQR